MDLDSITNPGNWTIAMGDSSQAGYDNDMMPLSDNDAHYPYGTRVGTYDGTRDEATANFQLTRMALERRPCR